MPQMLPRKNRMPLVLNAALMAFVITSAGCSNEEKFAVLDGEPAALMSDSRTVFINYWAVWCGPCIEEMPILANFREQNLDRVEVYAVNFDNPTSEQLRQDVEKLNVRIPSLLEDPASLFGVERPQALPTTWIVKEGQVVEVLLGPQTMESLLEVIKTQE